MVEKAALRRPFFTLSFHDLEFADRDDFGVLPVSSMTEPHLASAVEARLRGLAELVRRAQRTHRFSTLHGCLVGARSPAGEYSHANA